MPRTNVVFYRELRGEAPVLQWIGELRKTNQPAYETCAAAIERLAAFGHELRRPVADLLRDGIHELRVRKGRVNYRILYFFHGRNVAILGHALTKRRLIHPGTPTLRRRRHSHGKNERRAQNPGPVTG